MVMQTLHRTVPNPVGTIDRSNVEKTEYCPKCGKAIVRIPLTLDKFAIIHAEDLDVIEGRKFSADENQRNVNGKQLYYARDRRTGDRMHRLIAAKHVEDLTGLQVDHKSTDTLDNRWECNIRAATPAQNHWNRPPSARNTTGYKGVSAYGDKFLAKIRADGKDIRIGVFATAKEAAAAYNKMAERLRGEFAWLNSIESEQEVA